MSGASNNQEGPPDVIQGTEGEPQRLGTSQSQNDEWKGKYKELNKVLLLEKLVQATKYKDKKRLEKSVRAYKECRFSTGDCQELEDAEKLLDILQTKEALIEATTKKDEKDIELLLSSIEENEKEVKKKFKGHKKKFRAEDGYKHHLMFEMTEARRVTRLLASERRKNERSTTQSLKMDKNTMSEIKRYSNPPAVLHKVMQASLLLLGEDEETTEDWRKCAELANPDGRKGLNRRIQTLDVDDIKPEICARSKQILESLEYRKLFGASTGGAAFYVWAMGTVDDYQRTHSLEGVEPATTEQQKVLLGKVDTETPAEQHGTTGKVNKHRVQTNRDDKDIFQRNLRAPHSAGKAEDTLVEPKY